MTSGPSFLRMKASLFHSKEGVSSGPKPGMMATPHSSPIAAVN